jgi:peptidoglycan hydrolase FlgJ
MTIQALDKSFYADPKGLTALKKEASTQSPEALRETARQFESLFTTMMLKSMRQATPDDPLFGSDQQSFYQDMFDQQMAVQLSKGKGLGLADMLVQQLMHSAGVVADPTDVPTVPTAPTTPAAETAPMGDKTTSVWPPRTRDDFVRAILPAAEAAGRKLGVDPNTLVAHAALETGWGKSMPVNSDGQPSFNLFGIKTGVSWKGTSVDAATHEFQNGRMQSINAGFRAYDSAEQGIADYAQLLQGSPRYAKALGTGSDVAAFAKGLQAGGYATDPDYANKLISVARELKSRLSRPLTASAV